MVMKVAQENGVVLIGPDAGVEMLEAQIEKDTGVSAAEFWHKGGNIEINMETCDCSIKYNSREEFPNEDTPCDCGKNLFVKYHRDTAVVDLSQF